MSAPDAARDALVRVGSIPRDADGPVFPAPWAARAFALAVALHERGVFAWSEWSELLGGKVASATESDAGDPQAYWLAWLAALEELLASKAVARPDDLLDLKEAWRRAAEATPHGQPIVLDRQA